MFHCSFVSVSVLYPFPTTLVESSIIFFPVSSAREVLHDIMCRKNLAESVFTLVNWIPPPKHPSCLFKIQKIWTNRNHLYLIYQRLSAHTVIFTPNTRYVKVQLTKAFADSFQQLQFCHPKDVVGDTSMHVYHSQHSVNIENTEILTAKSRWFENRSKGGHKHQTVKSHEPKPQQRQWDTVYHQYGTISSFREWRQTDLRRGEGGLFVITSCNVPNNISRTTELTKLTGVSENFCEVNYYINLCIKCKKDCMIKRPG